MTGIWRPCVCASFPDHERIQAGCVPPHARQRRHLASHPLQHPCGASAPQQTVCRASYTRSQVGHLLAAGHREGKPRLAASTARPGEDSTFGHAFHFQANAHGLDRGSKVLPPAFAGPRARVSRAARSPPRRPLTQGARPAHNCTQLAGQAHACRAHGAPRRCRNREPTQGRLCRSI